MDPIKVELVLEGEDLLLQQLHLPGALYQLKQTQDVCQVKVSPLSGMRIRKNYCTDPGPGSGNSPDGSKSGYKKQILI